MVWDSKLFKENFTKFSNLINLNPELVEKKDPPITTRIRNINDKFEDESKNDIPIFDALLQIDRRVIKKLLSSLKKTKIKKNCN